MFSGIASSALSPFDVTKFKAGSTDRILANVYNLIGVCLLRCRFMYVYMCMLVCVCVCVCVCVTEAEAETETETEAKTETETERQTDEECM